VKVNLNLSYQNVPDKFGTIGVFDEVKDIEELFKYVYENVDKKYEGVVGVRKNTQEVYEFTGDDISQKSDTIEPTSVGCSIDILFVREQVLHDLLEELNELFEACGHYTPK